MLSAGSPLLACPRSNLRFNGAKVHVSSVISPQPGDETALVSPA